MLKSPQANTHISPALSADEMRAYFSDVDLSDQVYASDEANAALAGIMAHSPFLTSCIRKESSLLNKLVSEGADKVFEAVLKDTESLISEDIQEATLMQRLRVQKRRAALTIAWADLTTNWSLFEVTEAISSFADASISAATAFALRQIAAKGAISLQSQQNPEELSGFIVIGMGKLGARELNYSSDIDLICLYDPERIDADQPESLQKHMIRIARLMARILDERTVDGYVFRVDLRLRPDPASTPLAMSVLAAEAYYESLGQNWERAAMIKARVVAGDKEAGILFLRNLRPFVWRKSLDFAAIQDIHSIKRQIHAHKGGGEIAILGHNIKTGRGGIRDIEFFAQTQQLIWGGREARLRAPRTLDAIRVLVEQDHVTPYAFEELSRAYHFLRSVEHRLQMQCDEQTQTLPSEDKTFSDFAAFCGYARAEEFRDDMNAHLHVAGKHYGELFEDSPSLSSPSVEGNLAFTGVDTDHETITTLTKLGFLEAAKVDAALRAWHHGRIRAMRSTRAREILTELTPKILSVFAQQPNPDTAFHRFDAFLSALPAGVQLFSMFQINPELLDVLAEVMGQAPRLAEQLGRRPYLLDGVLDADFYERLPNVDALIDDCRDTLGDSVFFEDSLDAIRRWNSDRRFQIGIQMLRGVIDPVSASHHFSDVAEAALKTLIPLVMDNFSERHGHIADSDFGVIALGKLGSRELTPESDLDLVFVYDVPDVESMSTGERSLPYTQYFARLGQRIISAVTALTAEGRLYEVDVRLRPSGNKGPLATSLAGYNKYFEEEAWTWEFMALTRARVVFGGGELANRLSSDIQRFLSKERDHLETSKAVIEMRRRIEATHGAKSPWSIKQVAGGQIDVDFLLQFFVLMSGGEEKHKTTNELVQFAQQHAFLNEDDADTLMEAKGTYSALQTFLALVLGDVSDDGQILLSNRIQQKLAEITNQQNFESVEPYLRGLQEKVRAIFLRTLDAER